MALARTDLLGQVSGASGNFGTGTFTTNSFTPPSNSLLVVCVAAIENGGTTSLLTDLTVASSGLTFTNRVEQGASVTSFSTGVRIWTAPVTSGVSMTLDIDCGTRSIGMYAVSVVAYTNYDTTTPTGATGSTFQDSGFAGPPTPASLTLNAAPAATSEVLGVAGMDKSTAGTAPGAAFTEIHDLSNSDWGGLESEFRGSSTSTTVDWVDLRPGGGALFNFAAVAVEIRAAAAGGADPGFPMGLSQAPGFLVPSWQLVPWMGTETVATVLWTVALAGSVGPSGTLSRQDQQSLSGTVTPTGTATKQDQHGLSGMIPPAGAVVKQPQKPLAGSVTPTGTVVKQPQKPLGGSTTPMGVCVKQPQRKLAGAVTPTGVLAKLVGKILAGSVIPSGVLATIRTRLLSVAGQIIPIGTLVRQDAKPLGGSAVPAGLVAKSDAKAFTGSITPTGAVATIRTRLLAIAGALTPTGQITRLVGKVLAGSTAPSGQVVRSTAKRMIGSVTPTGVVATVRNRFLALAGGIAPSGLLARKTGKSVAGATTPVGTVAKRSALTIAGGVSPAGVLLKLLGRILAGGASPTGATTNELNPAVIAWPPTASAPVITGTYTADAAHVVGTYTADPPTVESA